MSDKNYHEGDSYLDRIVFKSSEEAIGVFRDIDGARPNTREAIHYFNEDSEDSKDRLWGFHPLDNEVHLDESNPLYDGFIGHLNEMEEGDSVKYGGLEMGMERNGRGYDFVVDGRNIGHFPCKSDLLNVAPQIFERYIVQNLEH